MFVHTLINFLRGGKITFKNTCNFWFFLVICYVSFFGCIFGDVTGVAKNFAVVTACVFANVTTIANKIFFDDVTANQFVDSKTEFFSHCSC